MTIRKNKVGIYKITCIKNNKCYIGQSINLTQRISDHKRLLKNNLHTNSHLQKAFNKYGENSFFIEVIELCGKDELDDKEKFWIELFDSTNRNCGYNFQSGGNLKTIVHEETKRKMSIIQRGVNSILNKEEVKEIKRLLLKNISTSELARMYGVTQSAIWRISNLDNWSWVSPELNESLKQLPIKKIQERNNRIKYLFNLGWSNKKIAEHLGHTNKLIASIVSSDYIEKHRKLADAVREDYKNNIPVEETLKKHNIKRCTYSKHIRELRHLREMEFHNQIIEMHQQGYMNKDIAAKLKCHRTTVTEHIKKHKNKEE